MACSFAATFFFLLLFSRALTASIEQTQPGIPKRRLHVVIPATSALTTAALFIFFVGEPATTVRSIEFGGFPLLSSILLYERIVLYVLGDVELFVTIVTVGASMQIYLLKIGNVASCLI